MPTNTLTDKICKTATTQGKPKKLFDGHGLYLYLTSTGNKIWRVAYRFDGKQKTKSLGPYPLITLAEARVKRDQIRRDLLAGIQPGKNERATAKLTLSEAIKSYWGDRKDVSASYLANASRGLAMHLEPQLGQPLSRVAFMGFPSTLCRRP